MASALKRAMRDSQKSRNDFCLDGGCERSTSPNTGREGRLAVAPLPCQTRYLRLHKHGRHIRCIVSFVPLVEDRIRGWQLVAIRCQSAATWVVSVADEWRSVSDWTCHFLCHLLAPRSSTLVGKKCGGDNTLTWVQWCQETAKAERSTCLPLRKGSAE